MKKLVVFVGFQSSGKNTAAKALISLGYVPLSFADALKDTLAAMFCWDRQMLEGITAESRVWRERRDSWWADRLGIPEFSPRWAMQNIGTNIMRRHFHEEIWVFNVERRLLSFDNDTSVVLIDARFPNEIALARRYNGHIERIKRGNDPSWYELAVRAFHEPIPLFRDYCHHLLHRQAHESEWAWLSCDLDGTTENNESIESLHADIIEKFH